MSTNKRKFIFPLLAAGFMLAAVVRAFAQYPPAGKCYGYTES